MGNEVGLYLEFAPHGNNGSGTLTARLNGDLIHVDTINLGKSKSRTDFIDTACSGQSDIVREAMKKELMELAVERTSKPEPTPDPQGAAEIDATAIIRPERFIHPDVSGLAVPSMTMASDKVVGRWNMYLRWSDGRRERVPMSSALELASRRKLFIHPAPCEPSPSTKAGWSAAARKQWLEGAPAPDPAELFARIAEMFARYIDLPPSHCMGITATAVCWTILSYVYGAWDAVPYLYVGGPLGSGKSRFFEVLSRLVFRPLNSSNMTGAALFRTLHTSGGVLLLDEAERLRNTADPATTEILSMLLAGYRKGGTATRLEPVGDSGFKTISFDVYGPKALACIAGLPPALSSRCIHVTMFRCPPGSDKPRRRIDADPKGWQTIRDSLHALALEHGSTWLELPCRSAVCPAMSGRDYELWQPILSIGSWIEEHGIRGLLKLLQEHAIRTIDTGRDDGTPDHDETLLRLLTERRQALDTPQSKEILELAQEQDKVGFRQWTPKGVSNVFRRYGISTVTAHGGRKVYRTDITELMRIQSTYGLTLGIEETHVHPD